jgi:hypothetical protein
MPPGTQSWAEMRTDIGRWRGQASRTARNTPADSAAVLEPPPYSSSRALVSGEMKLDSR